MATYYLDDTNSQGGSATSPYGSKTTSADTWSQLAAVGFSAGDIVYVHSSHSEVNAAADLDIDAEVTTYGIIVVRINFSTDAYDTTTTTQNFQTTTGAYEIDIDGSAIWYGLRFDSNERFAIGENYVYNEFVDCHFTVGAGDRFTFVGFTECVFRNCTFDSHDTANSSEAMFYISQCIHGVQFIDCTFNSTGLQYRDNLIGTTASARAQFIGCDMSGFSRSTFYIAPSNTPCWLDFIDCTMPTNYSVANFAGSRQVCVNIIRSGTNEDEAAKYLKHGTAIPEASIIRTGGHTKSFEITTNANCGYARPFYTPWIEVVVDATGSTNFDVYYASSTQLNEEQIFVELMLQDSATAPVGGFYTSQKRAVLGDTVGNHTTGGTWQNATGETYKEYIRVTASVGVADTIARVRVGIEKASQTDEVYVDPVPAIS